MFRTRLPRFIISASRMSSLAFFATILNFALALHLQAGIVVFSTNFDSGLPPQFSGVTTVESVQGYAGVGPVGNQFGGQFLRNDTGGPTAGTPGLPTILTLTGLPGHTSIDVNFLLAIIDSWDGIGQAFSPDVFNVRVDGTVVFSKVFQNTGGTSDYTPPPGGLLTSGSDRGFGSGTFFDKDSAFNMYLEPAFHNIPHSASTLTIEWYANGAGWQGNFGSQFDESWAIDNLQVVLNGDATSAVPEPGSLALMTLGIIGLFGVVRRRRIR